MVQIYASKPYLPKKAVQPAESRQQDDSKSSANEILQANTLAGMWENCKDLIPKSSTVSVKTSVAAGTHQSISPADVQKEPASELQLAIEGLATRDSGVTLTDELMEAQLEIIARRESKPVMNSNDVSVFNSIAAEIYG